MKATKEQQIEQIKLALNRMGIGLFETKSSYGDCDAKRNLQGHTHYVDDDTLRYFKARILRGRHHDGGLLYSMVESVNSKPHEGSKNKRGVVFDVFGTVLTERDQWFTTAEQAVAANYKFLNKLDAIKHTRNEIKARAKRQINEAREAMKALRAKKAQPMEVA